MTTVLLTDRAWPDDRVERDVLESAGFRLVAGPSEPADTATIDALAAEHQPAAILTCWAWVSANAIASSAALRVVARMGVGIDNIDLVEATRRGVWVTNVPDYCVEEVSDHAIALVLAWTRGLVASDREVRAGQWNPAGFPTRSRRRCTAVIWAVRASTFWSRSPTCRRLCWHIPRSSSPLTLLSHPTRHSLSCGAAPQRKSSVSCAAKPRGIPATTHPTTPIGVSR